MLSFADQISGVHDQSDESKAWIMIMSTKIEASPHASKTSPEEVVCPAEELSIGHFPLMLLTSIFHSSISAFLDSQYNRLCVTCCRNLVPSSSRSCETPPSTSRPHDMRTSFLIHLSSNFIALAALLRQRLWIILGTVPLRPPASITSLEMNKKTSSKIGSAPQRRVSRVHWADYPWEVRKPILEHLAVFKVQSLNEWLENQNPKLLSMGVEAFK